MNSISAHPMLTAKKDEIELALERRSRLPRLSNETNLDWARRLSTLEDFKDKWPDEIKLDIARIIRCQPYDIKPALDHHFTKTKASAAWDDSLERMAREIAEYSGRIHGESDVSWAHRICETKEIVQTCGQRITLLSKITGKQAGSVRTQCTELKGQCGRMMVLTS